MGAEEKGRVPPPPPPHHQVGWAEVVGVWVCSRTAKWTVMRHMSEGREKEGWYFSREACSSTKHCSHIRSSHFYLHVQHIGPTHYIYIKPLIFFTRFLPCLRFSPLPFPLTPSLLPFPLSFPSLPPTFPLSLSPPPASPSVPICGPRQSRPAQTIPKGKVTSSGDALLSLTDMMI